MSQARVFSSRLATSVSRYYFSIRFSWLTIPLGQDVNGRYTVCLYNTITVREFVHRLNKVMNKVSKMVKVDRIFSKKKQLKRWTVRWKVSNPNITWSLLNVLKYESGILQTNSTTTWRLWVSCNEIRCKWNISWQWKLTVTLFTTAWN